MGGSLSTVLAGDMDYLLDQVLHLLDNNISFLHKYVDGTICATHKSQVQPLLLALNSFNNRIQFTLEVESHN